MSSLILWSSAAMVLAIQHDWSLSKMTNSCIITASKYMVNWNTSLSVREITKSSSTFAATNLSSNMIWFHQLQDTVEMKSNHTVINYNHNNIAIRYIIVCKVKFLLPNLVAFISQKNKKTFGFATIICWPTACERWYSCVWCEYRYMFVVWI